jgi:hypothetical protein
MSSSSRSRVPSAVGAFLAEFSSRRLVAGLALVVAMGSAEGVRANPPAVSLSVSQYSPNTVRVTFNPTGTPPTAPNPPPYDYYPALMGGEFVNLSALSNLFTGSLISVTANVTLESFGKKLDGSAANVDQNNNPLPSTDPNYETDYETTANDLTIYIGTSAGLTQANNQGLLQLGGLNGIPGVPSGSRYFWLSGVTDDQLYGSSFAFSPNLPLVSGGLSDVWLGNGYTDGISFGRWSGSLDFTFASSTGSGVPDASRTALLLAPGTLLLLGVAGRARRRG